MSWDNTPPSAMSVAGQSFDNQVPVPAAVAGQSFIDQVPASAAVPGQVFTDGPAWGADVLVGGSLYQYSAEGELLNTYAIIGNSAINASTEILSITTDKDWSPWHGYPEGATWALEDPNGMWFRVQDTSLGTAGSPYSGDFQRLGTMPDVGSVVGQSFNNGAPTAAATPGQSLPPRPGNRLITQLQPQQPRPGSPLIVRCRRRLLPQGNLLMRPLRSLLWWMASLSITPPLSRPLLPVNPLLTQPRESMRILEPCGQTMRRLNMFYPAPDPLPSHQWGHPRRLRWSIRQRWIIRKTTA